MNGFHVELVRAGDRHARALLFDPERLARVDAGFDLFVEAGRPLASLRDAVRRKEAELVLTSCPLPDIRRAYFHTFLPLGRTSIARPGVSGSLTLPWFRASSDAG